MNSERKLITEYFNKYYPKKTYYVHNEVFELLLGVFFGFFFSALKDSISNRAVQVVSSLQDEGKSKRFFDEAEKVTSELERYAKENKELSDKLEKIEEVLKNLQSSTTQLQENPSKTENVPFKEQPVVTELSKFTTEVFSFLKEVQQESKQQNKELQDTLSAVVQVLRELGVNQASLVENFKKQTENAVKSGNVSQADVQQAERELNNTLGSIEPSADVEPQTSELSKTTPLKLNKVPEVSTGNGSVTLTYGTNEISFVHINKQVTEQLVRKLVENLPVSSEVKQNTVNAVKKEIKKDTTEANTFYVDLNNGTVSTTETEGAVPVTVDSSNTLKELEKSDSEYTKNFVELASKLNKSQLLLTADAGVEKVAKEKAKKEEEQKAKKKEEQEKENKEEEENKEKESVLLNTLEGFISKKLKFPIVELSEKKTQLKAADNLVQYFTFESFTDDKSGVVVTGEVQNLSTDLAYIGSRVELNERKQSLQSLLYTLFEEENKKKYTGKFTVQLKVKEAFEVEGKKVFLSKTGTQKVLSAVTTATAPEEPVPEEPKPDTKQQKPEAEVKAPEAEPEQLTTPKEPKKREPKKVEQWPKSLYFAEKRGTLPLRENSPLLIESPQSGTFVRLKYDSVDKATNVATYVGEVEYDAQTALPKSALSAVLEVVLNQERGQQLKVSVASYVPGEYSVVRVLQKGKLTSDGSNVLTRLLSTGDRGANEQLARENFATGVINGGVVTLKNFTTLSTEKNVVLVFPVGSKLFFLPLTESELPNTLTALRGLARQKNESFPLYSLNGKRITVQGHDAKDFQSNLVVIIEKLKSLVKTERYSKALQQSRTESKQPNITSENVRFGFLSGSFDKKEGFKNSYPVVGAQQEQQ